MGSENFKECPRCGRAFTVVPGRTLCRRCIEEREDAAFRIEEAVQAYNLTTAEEVARHTGLPPNEVREVVAGSAVLRRYVAIDRVCALCGSRLAQQGSDYCLDCRLELNRDLGRASDEIASSPRKLTPIEESQAPPSTSIRDELNRKRARASAANLDLTPRAAKWGR